MIRMTRVIGTVVAFTCLTLSARAAVTLGQWDNFEDGTTQGWTVGATHPSPPANEATGGPGGADDNYLTLVSRGGGGPGSKLSAFNTSQWGGDYLAAGITHISMDLNNLGAEDLVIRLLFANPVAGPPTDVAITDGVLVPANSGWTSHTFAIDPALLTVEAGSATGALSSATELRLFHNPAAAFSGPPNAIPSIIARLGVDNIRTAAIPEPSSLALLGIGLSGLLARRRSGARSKS